MHIHILIYSYVYLCNIYAYMYEYYICLCAYTYMYEYYIYLCAYTYKKTKKSDINYRAENARFVAPSKCCKPSPLHSWLRKKGIRGDHLRSSGRALGTRMMRYGAHMIGIIQYHTHSAFLVRDNPYSNPFFEIRDAHHKPAPDFKLFALYVTMVSNCGLGACRSW